MNELYQLIIQTITERDLLLLHAGVTCYMMGLICFVQIVHYPLFNAVGAEAHLNYHRAHVYWTTWAVGPAMIIEAASAFFLCFSASLPTELTLTGVTTLGIVWLSTALIQVPCHERLSRSFDSKTHRRLVQSNWIRCIGWSIRAVIALALLR